MQRVKNIDYDEDDLYDDDFETEDAVEESQNYTAEDRENFATYTPVVQAELEEAGLQASDREVEDALWHYYWDVGRTVAYLKNTRTPRKAEVGKASGQGIEQGTGGSSVGSAKEKKDAGKVKAKAGNKFDEAAAKSAEKAGSHGLSSSTWFRDVPWSGIPCSLQGQLIPLHTLPRPQLLGGSSKLAKLAEERRKKAAASPSTPSPSNTGLSALDRLSKSVSNEENTAPQTKIEARKYPIRKKKEPTPPPPEPEPEVEEPVEEAPDLRASPTQFGETLATTPRQTSGSDVVPFKNLLDSRTDHDPFQEPSPDDTILRAQQRSIPKPKAQPSPSLAKKTEALKLDETPSTPAPPPQPRVKSNRLKVPKLWAEERSKRKPSAAFVVIGHVDHGKSTLMGRLLLDTGAVSQRDIDRYQTQATQIGKSSFALAWVLDTDPEERERGVTSDIAQFHFSTPQADFTIIDAPGHRDFVPNMISGASMADFAVLVVDVNQLESGMRGQTREHVVLARACGVRRLVVAVNKFDVTVPGPWEEGVFADVRGEVSSFLSEEGFKEDDVVFVPCAGLSGENVVNPVPDKGVTNWAAKQSGTLLAALEDAVSASTTTTTTSTTAELIHEPLRLQIADVFKSSINNPLSISGRLTSGSVQPGDHLRILPDDETAAVKSLEIAGESRDYAVAGQIASLHLTDIEAQHLRAGDLICDFERPVSVVTGFVAHVRALEAVLPEPVDVHFGRLTVAGRVSALVAVTDEGGEVVLRKKPRVFKAGSWGVLDVLLEEGVPIEGGERVILRSNGRTLAAGKVQSAEIEALR